MFKLGLHQERRHAEAPKQRILAGRDSVVEEHAQGHNDLPLDQLLPVPAMLTMQSKRTGKRMKPQWRFLTMPLPS